MALMATVTVVKVIRKLHVEYFWNCIKELCPAALSSVAKQLLWKPQKKLSLRFSWDFSSEDHQNRINHEVVDSFVNNLHVNCRCMVGASGNLRWYFKLWSPWSRNFIHYTGARRCGRWQYNISWCKSNRRRCFKSSSFFFLFSFFVCVETL